MSYSASFLFDENRYQVNLKEAMYRYKIFLSVNQRKTFTTQELLWIFQDCRINMTHLAICIGLIRSDSTGWYSLTRLEQVDRIMRFSKNHAPLEKNS